MAVAKPQTVRLPPELRKKIEADANKDRRSFNSQIVTILEHHYASKKKAK